MAHRKIIARTRKETLVAAAALLLFAAPLAARIPLLRRGPAHEQLDFLIGRWRAHTQRRLPVELEITSVTTFAWKYGGVYLEEYDPTHLEATGTIHNLMLMTWDPRRQLYQGFWLDNVSPTTVPFQARWKDDRTLVLDTGDIEFAGRPHRAVLTYTRLSDSRLRKQLRWSWDHADLELVATTDRHKLD
jgi:hypothetical protein